MDSSNQPDILNANMSKLVKLVLALAFVIFMVWIIWAIVAGVRSKQNNQAKSPSETTREQNPTLIGEPVTASAEPAPAAEQTQPPQPSKRTGGKKRIAIVEEFEVFESTEPTGAWASAGVNEDGSTWTEARAN